MSGNLAPSRMVASDFSSLSSKISPMATSSTFSLPVRSCVAAWVPRPPHPTRPARSFSLPAPRTSSGLMIVNAVAPAADDFCKKDLRDTGFMALPRQILSWRLQSKLQPEHQLDLARVARSDDRAEHGGRGDVGGRL